ncbi:MAG: hypothetical protein U0W40_08310 [Acidimicrobiia bacterium]
MFKRVTWLGVGFAAGAATTVVAARKAKQQMERYKPNAVVVRTQDKVVDSLTRVRDQLAAAVDDGKTAAKERETQLRADGLGGKAGPGSGKGDRRDVPIDPPTTL